MKFLWQIFNITQFFKFVKDVFSWIRDMHVVSMDYFKNSWKITQSEVSVGTKKVVANNLGYHSLKGPASIWFLVFYYSFLLIFALNFNGWFFYILCACVLEIVLLLLSCFLRWVWPFRIVVIFFLAALWDIQNAGGVQGAYVNEIALDFLSKITFTEYNWWADYYNSATAYWCVFSYLKLYFLVIFFPYFCMGLIIFLPLISSIFLFTFGYLIGHSLAGRFAAASIFVSALSSYYIWFIYPIYRVIMVEKYSNGLGIFTMQTAPDFETSGTIKFFITELVEREWIRPLEEPAFVLTKDSDHLNLWLDFGNFIDNPFFNANFEFVVDAVSVVMVTTISTISFFVHAYSTIYMKNDPHQIRFFALLSLFTFFMIVLVTGGNLIMLYIGWEGVGLTSFLLIAFWYTRVGAVKAAFKAMLMNKIGDMFLVLAISLITYYSVGATTLANVSLIVDDAENVIFWGNLTVLDVIAISLAIAAFVKSAQIFFHTWLADAMEGPTPVSALLHAATMVTAGVYLVIRFSPVFEHSAIARWLVFFVGLNTIVLSSFIAMTQYDIKKIIAYSTCSQLGLMFLACGLSAYDFALYHFFNHAFFKCLLFLIAGVIIHQLRNEQDIRKMGGLAKKMPFTFMCFFIANLSLVGMPGFSGANSKDQILHLTNFIGGCADNSVTAVSYFLLNIIIYLTAAYSGRLMYYVFLGPANYNKRYFSRKYVDVAYKEKLYTFIFTSLAFMSIFGGRLFKFYFITSDATNLDFNSNFVDIHNDIEITNIYHHILPSDTWFSYIAFFITLHAIFLICYLTHFFMTSKTRVWYLHHNKVLYELFCFFNRKCYFDDVYNAFIVRPFFRISYVFNYAAENGIFKNILSFLWAFILLPLYARVSLVRLSLVEHFLFTSFGLALLLWGTHSLATTY